MIAILSLQAASPAAPAVPVRFSILADACGHLPTGASSPDVVVCGRRADGSERLPLPGERGPPDHPSPVNPDGSGTGALAAGAAPCAARLQSCQLGIGLPPQLVAAVVDGVSGALNERKWRAARRRDGAARVAIDLGKPAPAASAQDMQP